MPGKNYMPFHGKPMICHPLDVAYESKLFWDIVVYTDDENIKGLCKGKYAVIDRPAEGADDHATLTDVLREALKNFTEEYDSICLMLPTAVFVTAEDLKKSEGLLKAGFDGVASVCRYTPPIQRALRVDWYSLEFADPEYAFTRTQDCGNRYYDAGQFYWIKPESFNRQHAIFMQNMAPHVLPLAVDIDTIEDFKKAEALYNVR